MKVALFSKEYPPNVYGGAGVHVEYLSRALAKRMDVEVRAFGNDAPIAGNPAVRFYPEWPEAKRDTDPRFAGAVDAFERSLRMAKDRIDADLVHCHTWYTDMAGIVAAQLWNIPSVLTIHSLEPLRPLESRTTRPGLPPQRLDGTHRHRAGQRRHRRLPRDARRRPAPLRHPR